MLKFYKKMKNVNISACGILDYNNKIHTLGTDSKIIGRIFEMFTQPVLEEIALELNLKIKTPESQTIYPDFILMSSENSKEKIAIDIKTTYINNNNSPIKFTLGSFGSYMRNNTKNIEYQYTDYKKHYVIGFIYKRNGHAQESKIFDYNNIDKIACPYKDVKYFIQEKYKIAGDKPGSGNTENIGSFSTINFNELKDGKGPFSSLGHEIFDMYWKFYPKYRSLERNYNNINEFLAWLKKQTQPPKLLYDYNFDEIINKLENIII